MKIFKFFGLLIIAFLVACQSNEVPYTEIGDPEATEIEVVNNGNSDIQTEDDPDEELVDLEPIPYIFRNHITRRNENQLTRQDSNQVYLMDLTIGELIAIYDGFDEEDFVNNVWDLGNGYYAVFVGHGISSEHHLGTQTERNFRIVIFDENLNHLESLPYDEEEFLFLWSSILRFVNGELYIYGWEWGIGPLYNFQRINIHTRETETLFQGNQILRLNEFIGEHQILVSEFVPPEYGAAEMDFRTLYGVLNLETGIAELFEIEQNYSYEHFIIGGSQAIMTERDPREMFADVDITNKVVIINLEDMSNEVVQLAYGDSFSARLSFDGNDIVTINVTESVFRKYDRNGVIIVEMDLELPAEISSWNPFEIIPVTAQIYVIRINPAYLEGPRVQIVTLP